LALVLVDERLRTSHDGRLARQTVDRDGAARPRTRMRHVPDPAPITTEH
jgi:hypothetical protein